MLLNIMVALVGSPPWFPSAAPSKNPFWPATYKMSLWVRKGWPWRDFRVGGQGCPPCSPKTCSTLLHWLIGSCVELGVWDGLFPARGGSLMWPPEREHTQKLSNEEMVHNCLLAPNNLGRRVTREGNATFTFPLQQPTVILDQPSAPVCHSSLQACDFPLGAPLVISGRITALSSRWPGVSKLTHDFAPCKTASCFCSGFFLHRVLAAAGRAEGSPVCLAVITPQPKFPTEQWGQNHDGQKRSMLMPCTEFSLPCISFFAVSSSDTVVCIPN